MQSAWSSCIVCTVVAVNSGHIFTLGIPVSLILFCHVKHGRRSRANSVPFHSLVNSSNAFIAIWIYMYLCEFIECCANILWQQSIYLLVFLQIRRESHIGSVGLLIVDILVICYCIFKIVRLVIVACCTYVYTCCVHLHVHVYIRTSMHIADIADTFIHCQFTPYAVQLRVQIHMYMYIRPEVIAGV